MEIEKFASDKFYLSNIYIRIKNFTIFLFQRVNIINFVIDQDTFELLRKYFKHFMFCWLHCNVIEDVNLLHALLCMLHKGHIQYFLEDLEEMCHVYRKSNTLGTNVSTDKCKGLIRLNQANTDNNCLIPILIIIINNNTYAYSPISNAVQWTSKKYWQSMFSTALRRRILAQLVQLGFMRFMNCYYHLNITK